MTNDHHRVRAAVRKALDLVGAHESAKYWESAELTVGDVPGFAVERTGDALNVTYHGLADAMRASLVLGAELEQVRGQRQLPRLSVMIDMSRNAVMRVETVERYLAHVALMGYTSLFLYLEDTYEVPGHPYIGHGRGRYSQAELRHIDDVAESLGIEVVPVIQTLGHLRQILKWPPYHGIRLVPEVIRIGDTRALELVRTMIAAATAPFRSRRVHLGLDEAYGFSDDATDPSDRMGLFLKHVNEVVAVCEELGVEPMMWSDMLFDVEHGAKDFFRTDRTIAGPTLRSLPSQLILVYWDYFHHTASHYEEKLRQHAPMDAVVAGGCSSWGRLWARLPESITACTAAVEGAVAAGVDEAMITMWGNDGNECDYFSCLPALAHAADRAYGLDAESTERSLVAVGVTEPLWIMASALDDPFDDSDRSDAIEPPNPSKWLLWMDPLISFADIGLSEEVVERMRDVQARLARSTRAGLDSRLDFVGMLAGVLAQKAQLHLDLRPAYRRGDRDRARAIAEGLVPDLVADLSALARCHEVRWMTDNKPFGWEVLERRYAGLCARLESTRRSILAWCEGRSAQIETLEVEPLRVAPDTVSSTVPWTVFATPAGMA